MGMRRALLRFLELETRDGPTSLAVLGSAGINLGIRTL
jgi:hypothetical protein